MTPHILWHSRRIERPADDSVVRKVARELRPVRLGRGLAPVERELPFTLAEPILATGAHMKLTVALAWQNRLVVSPHISDMDSRRSAEVFQQVVDDLQRLYRVDAKQIVCDLHPGYPTTRWAREQSQPHHPVAHHHAHAAALYGEYHCRVDILVFTWDGTGMGLDNTLWGGETLYGRPGHWQRVARLRPFRLTGGDAVARQPWKSAAALCWEAGHATPDFDVNHQDIELLHNAWQAQLNTIHSSSAGRLFDAASALTDTLTTASFEGQPPMLLEAQAEGLTGNPWQIHLHQGNDMLELDWGPWLIRLTDNSRSQQQRAADLHETLAQSIATIARQLHRDKPFTQVGLSGGVFQNRILMERALQLLTEDGFEVLLPTAFPCNDAAISIGQIMEYGYRNHKDQ